MRQFRRFSPIPRFEWKGTLLYSKNQEQNSVWIKLLIGKNICYSGIFSSHASRSVIFGAHTLRSISYALCACIIKLGTRTEAMQIKYKINKIIFFYLQVKKCTFLLRVGQTNPFLTTKWKKIVCNKEETFILPMWFCSGIKFYTCRINFFPPSRTICFF